MPEVSDIIVWVGEAFLLAIAAAVVTRLLTGGIRTDGLLAGTNASGRGFVSSARVQLLISTLAAATQYLSQVIHNPQVFPDIPRSWLMLLGGSHVLYHGAKLQGRLNKRFFV